MHDPARPPQRSGDDKKNASNSSGAAAAASTAWWAIREAPPQLQGMHLAGSDNGAAVAASTAWWATREAAPQQQGSYPNLVTFLFFAGLAYLLCYHALAGRAVTLALQQRREAEHHTDARRQV